MMFENLCGCIYEHDILSKAIQDECVNSCKEEKKTYRVTLHNSYPSVCIAHKHFYIHNLVGKVKYGEIPTGYVLHHKDLNKRNNLLSNIVMLPNAEHSKLHGKLRVGKDYRSENGKLRGINAAAKKRFRKDVSKEKIKEMQEHGMSIYAIARELKCGVNTVYRRLGKQW